MGKVNNNTSKDVNIKITNSQNKILVENIKAYCDLNNLNYVDFAVRVFENFFKDERTRLEIMTKEQLIDVIMQWKSEEKS